MTLKELSEIRKNYILRNHPYQMYFYKDYNYSILDNIIYRKKSGRGDNNSFNDVIIMADTETSKKNNSEHNHVVAWTISLRAFGLNICTLYGRKPSEMMECIQKLIDSMNGYETIIYFHNLAYDYVFLRKFLYQQFGTPEKQLNTKPHYPIMIKFDRLTLKDSLILAQRSLEKWAKDLEVEHQKAVGSWEYSKIRSQNEIFNKEELKYIEFDTLAGVECIDTLKNSLKKSLFSMPYTATGIPREEVIKRGTEVKAKDLFLRNSLTFEQYLIAIQVYHGGYTHSNRHYINKTIIEWVYGKDFASSYPYTLLSEKFPSTNFHDLDVKDINYILENSEKYAFMFKLVLVRPRLKNDSIPMPVLQYSKAVSSINVIPDNGRVLCADYFEIYITEIDLEVIAEQYDWDYAKCIEVQVAEKDYLPRWFTDYVFELFEQKTYLKGSPDVVAYALAKSKLNSLYGLCCQKSIRDEIEEDYDSGEYILTSQMTEEFYDKYLHNRRNILNYQTGIWVTAYAMRNLFTLGKCVDYENGGEWLYSDTDSCYSTKWNEDKVQEYNDNCKRKLKDNGYGCVNFNNREYWLGIAEDDSIYTEFRYQGAKRYCGRSKEDGKLHITVAGVPKKTGTKCLKDNIENFTTNFIFSGAITGKLTHQYHYVDEIYFDEYGNETGDSINLIPCDYKLDSVYTADWESVFNVEELGGFYGEE